MNTSDRRVVHTKKALRNALLELLKKKSLSQITVKELCYLADVNRNTFYSHYSSTADLLAEICSEYKEKMQQLLSDAVLSGDNMSHILGVLNFWLEHREFGEAIYSENNDLDIRDLNCKNAFSSVMLTWINADKPVPTDELKWLFVFMAGGMDAIIRVWIKNGMKENPDFIAALSEKMCNSAAHSIFDE